MSIIIYLYEFVCSLSLNFIYLMFFITLVQHKQSVAALNFNLLKMAVPHCLSASQDLGRSVTGSFQAAISSSFSCLYMVLSVRRGNKSTM